METFLGPFAIVGSVFQGRPADAAFARLLQSICLIGQLKSEGILVTPGEELNRAFSLLVLGGQSLDHHCSLSSQELI